MKPIKAYTKTYKNLYKTYIKPIKTYTKTYKNLYNTYKHLYKTYKKLCVCYILLRFVMFCLDSLVQPRVRAQAQDYPRL